MRMRKKPNLRPRMDACEDITVLTLKKTREQTLIRNMSGREVSRNREAFDFEARI